MPAPGDQYNSPNIKNPFAEHVVNQFTAQEIATLQARLNKQLGPEYLSYRPGGGGTQVAYLEGQKAIALANDVFGFNGWSSSLQTVQIDFVDENPQNGKISMGLSIIVRITLKDGTYHEDIGYGSIQNSPAKAAAFEKAKKEAATDGLKRALRSFGNVLGNCLYDKDYLKKVKPMKVKPVAFQEGELHRHPDFAPPVKQEVKREVKQETINVKTEPHRTPIRTNQIIRTRTEALGGTSAIIADLDDEFGENFFDDVDISEHQGDEFTFEPVSAAGEPISKSLEASKAADHSSDTVSGRTTPGPNGGPPRQPVPRMQPNGFQQQKNHNQGKPPVNAPNGRAPQTPIPQQNNPRSNVDGRANGSTVETNVPSKPQFQPKLNHQNQQPLRPTPPDAASRPQVQPQQNQQPLRPTPPNAASNPQYQPQQNQSLRPTPPQAESGPQGNNASVTNQTTNQRPSGPPVGFVTSRVAERLQNSDATTPLSHLPAFNPHAESPVPKEKRTPGIDHTRSKHVSREDVGIPEKPQLVQPPAQGNGGIQRAGGAPYTRPNLNFVNPQQTNGRKIGMPGQSPLANRGAYKPPTVVAGVKRPPLQDVSNQSGGPHGANGPVTDAQGHGHDDKRPKLEGRGPENVGPRALGT